MAQLVEPTQFAFLSCCCMVCVVQLAVVYSDLYVDLHVCSVTLPSHGVVYFSLIGMSCHL